MFEHTTGLGTQPVEKREVFIMPVLKLTQSYLCQKKQQGAAV